MRSSVKLKICGMREAENIKGVSALGPDYLGFIFYPESPRFVGSSFTDVASNSMLQRVGVFVNAPTTEIASTVMAYNLDFAQLHGDETAAQCNELKSIGIKLIKAFRIGESFDFDSTKEFEQSCDFFLFDTSGQRYGGNGVAFDWTLLKKYNQALPFFLSGGLTISSLKNLHELRSMNLHAIDVNSGIELAPGRKDINQVKEIIEFLETNY